MEGHQAVKLMLITCIIDKATAQWLDVSLSSLKPTEMYDSSFLVKPITTQNWPFWMDGRLQWPQQTVQPLFIYVYQQIYLNIYL